MPTPNDVQRIQQAVNLLREGLVSIGEARIMIRPAQPLPVATPAYINRLMDELQTMYERGLSTFTPEDVEEFTRRSNELDQARQRWAIYKQQAEQYTLPLAVTPYPGKCPNCGGEGLRGRCCAYCGGQRI